MAKMKKAHRVLAGKRIGIHDLAHFQICAVKESKENRIRLRGTFTHLLGVRKGTGALYVAHGDPVYGELVALNENTQAAEFLAWPHKTELKPGASFPYFDYYWDAADIRMVLEPASRWRRLKFKPEDMVRYHDPEVPGWWKSHVASRPVSDGATDVHTVKNGWDHEHCHFCRREIGQRGDTHGYFSNGWNQWLCETCYKKHAARHDLSFLQFK